MSDQTKRPNIVVIDVPVGDFVDPNRAAEPRRTVVVLAPNQTLVLAQVPDGLKPDVPAKQAVLNLFHEILDANGHKTPIHKVEDLLGLKADVLDLHGSAVMPYLSPR